MHPTGSSLDVIVNLGCFEVVSRRVIAAFGGEVERETNEEKREPPVSHSPLEWIRRKLSAAEHVNAADRVTAASYISLAAIRGG